MQDDAAEIDEVLARLASGVAAGLPTAAGWRRRPWADDVIAAITRTHQNGVLTVVEIRRTSFSYQDHWPTEVETALGIGFEPALDLMPLLALPCRAALVDDPDDRREVITISGLDGVERAVTRIVDFVERTAPDLEARFTGVATIDAALEQQIAQARQDLNDRSDDSERADYTVHVGYGTQQRLVLMTATGRVDEARALLADYTADDSGDLENRQRRRFIVRSAAAWRRVARLPRQSNRLLRSSLALRRLRARRGRPPEPRPSRREPSGMRYGMRCGHRRAARASISCALCSRPSTRIVTSTFLRRASRSTSRCCTANSNRSVARATRSPHYA